MLLLNNIKQVKRAVIASVAKQSLRDCRVVTLLAMTLTLTIGAIIIPNSGYAGTGVFTVKGLPIETLRKCEWGQGESDYSLCDFIGQDLSAKNLENVNFHRACLKWGKLQGSKLMSVDLSYANLEGVDLREANLKGANLSNANLQGADLSKASLQNTNLQNAQLQGANLSGANFEGVKLAGANLEGAMVDGNHCMKTSIGRCIIYISE